MENNKLNQSERQDLDLSLHSLGMQDLKERLEFSTVTPGGGDDTFHNDFFDFENCCNDHCCSGNGASIPDIINTELD